MTIYDRTSARDVTDYDEWIFVPEYQDWFAFHSEQVLVLIQITVGLSTFK